MARLALLLFLASAALTQASLPTNNAQEAAHVVLSQRVSVYNQKAKPLCKECEKVITVLKKIVENPETEQKLQEILTDACNLPALSKFKNICLSLVNDVVVVIHELQSILDNPTKFCDSIKLCETEAPGVNTITKRFLLSVASKIVQDVHRPSPIMAIDTCGLCQSALNELKQWLQTPQVIEKIQDETEKVCKYLGSYQQKCDEVIETYVPQVVGWLVEALSQPEETCAAIHLCKKQTSLFTNMYQLNRPVVSHPHLDRFMANISAIQHRRGFNMGCFACKTAVGTALKFLQRDGTETKIAQDVTSLVCKILPSSQKDGCYDFLGIYGKAALQLTFTEWTASDICSAVHACSSVAVTQFEALFARENSKFACDTCKVLSKVLSVELQKPELQQDIINVMSSGCRLLPAKFSNKCQSYIQTYLPYILDDTVALSLVPQLCTCGDLVIEYVPLAVGYVADFFSRNDVCSVLRVC